MLIVSFIGLKIDVIRRGQISSLSCINDGCHNSAIPWLLKVVISQLISMRASEIGIFA